MLAQQNISLSCLLNYTGYLIALSLVALSQVLTIDDLMPWGFVVLVLACGYSMRLALAARDSLLLATFELGRRHERERVSAIR